jgi:hypothetical protein
LVAGAIEARRSGRRRPLCRPPSLGRAEAARARRGRKRALEDEHLSREIGIDVRRARGGIAAPTRDLLDGAQERASHHPLRLVAQRDTVSSLPSATSTAGAAAAPAAVPIAAGIFLDVFNVFLLALELFGGQRD